MDFFESLRTPGSSTPLFRVPRRGAQRHHSRFGNPEIWEFGPDRVRDIVWREVRIVLLGHARVGMAELARNHAERHALHRQMTAVGVPKNVEADRRRDFGDRAGDLERTNLV